MDTLSKLSSSSSSSASSAPAFSSSASTILGILSVPKYTCGLSNPRRRRPMASHSSASLQVGLKLLTICPRKVRVPARVQVSVTASPAALDQYSNSTVSMSPAIRKSSKVSPSVLSARIRRGCGSNHSGCPCGSSSSSSSSSSAIRMNGSLVTPDQDCRRTSSGVPQMKAGSGGSAASQAAAAARSADSSCGPGRAGPGQSRAAATPAHAAIRTDTGRAGRVDGVRRRAVVMPGR